MGYHWSGLYNPGLVETLGKFRKSQANDFPPQVKLVVPVGLMLLGRHFDEATVFRAAHAFVNQVNWETPYNVM